MSFEELLANRRIKAQSPDRKTVGDQMSLAERDAAVARQTLPIDPDWAFTIAYNATLQASRALMFSRGYRPRGPDQHVTVIQFLEEAASEELSGVPAEDLSEAIAVVDQMRRKRHRAVYDAAGRIGASEAEQAVRFAENYVERIREWIALGEGE